MTFNLQNITLILLWIAYAAIHSILASIRVKKWFEKRFPGKMRYYRLLFNTQAVLLLMPVLYLSEFSGGGYLLHYSGPWIWVGVVASLVAAAGTLWTFKYYDLLEFAGFRQVMEKKDEVEDQESFKISPPHRIVRHPWYFLGLLALWSRNMTEAQLWLAIGMTLYLWIGSKFEENKLSVYHGVVYDEYRKKVPGLLPKPWRWLKKSDLAELEKINRPKK